MRKESLPPRFSPKIVCLSHGYVLKYKAALEFAFPALLGETAAFPARPMTPPTTERGAVPEDLLMGGVAQQRRIRKSPNGSSLPDGGNGFDPAVRSARALTQSVYRGPA
jgi:hypothetical protein